VDCYSCERPAINACKRCAKTYCDEHGNAQYCAECLQPSSALPSFNLYRASLLTMLVGTAVAVFLFVRPPGESGGAAPVIVGQSSPTPTASGGTVQPTIPPRTPVPSASPATPTAAASPTPAFLQYTVQDGDTLFDIALANLPPGDDLQAYVDAIASLNGIGVEDPLAVGTVIQLPPLPPAP